MKAMNIGMGVFLIIVAILKLADWKGFVEAYSKYDLIAQNSKVYAYAYPLIELGLGIAFIAASLNQWPLKWIGLFTFLLFSIGTIGVAKNLMSPNPLNCACLGTLFKIPLTKFTLVEDVLMALMGLFMFLRH